MHRDIMDIMDILNIMIITAWMAMAGAVSALVPVFAGSSITVSTFQVGHCPLPQYRGAV